MKEDIEKKRQRLWRIAWRNKDSNMGGYDNAHGGPAGYDDVWIDEDQKLTKDYMKEVRDRLRDKQRPTGVMGGTNAARSLKIIAWSPFDEYRDKPEGEDS